MKFLNTKSEPKKDKHMTSKIASKTENNDLWFVAHQKEWDIEIKN